MIQIQTDKVRVKNGGRGAKEAMEETEKLADALQLDDKVKLRIRLLVEEMLGMIDSITGDFNASFWAENVGKEIRLHLSAEADVDYAKKMELIDSSTSKKNTAARGIMGKIRDIVENSYYSMMEVSDLKSEFANGDIMYGFMGMHDPDAMMASPTGYYTWSLDMYRNNIEEARDQDPIARDAWDELEKSIIGNIADDVSVSVRGQKIEMVIKKAI